MVRVEVETHKRLKYLSIERFKTISKLLDELVNKGLDVEKLLAEERKKTEAMRTRYADLQRLVKLREKYLQKNQQFGHNH